ncbi:MAG TPA: P63C domain-containing protein [Pseudolabrys sp.]|uniref:P63C domain-containing protein n=1 Tax=Pseudolabrys sp. TaxID=1960880 RepID=UPI002DDD23BB|nr:P63C domain-containing protein [Pseudolabrys sp.]HEV2629520.1 P63C domain-containing protein [Pseudolabrys sp.]
MDDPKDESKQAGGFARAKALSQEQRSAIARRAALARFGKDLPKAIAEGVLKIGDVRLPCAVLDDKQNTRVFSQEGFLTAIGRAGKAKGGEGASVDGRPAFLRAQNLEPFISNELLASTVPVEFIPWKGPGYQGRAFGYKASLLPGVCWVYQDALVAGKLTAQQKHIGIACKALLKALTNHAIEDLVDRATGFDDRRKHEAIIRILEKYIEPEKLTWVRMFDNDFYRHVFRLNKWAFDPEKTARPSVLGHWTNNIYDRLAPGIRPALHAKVKRNATGKPTEKLTQYLTPEEGKPRLAEMLEGVKAIMRLSRDKEDFWEKMDVAYPKHPKVEIDELILPFPDLPRLPKPK